jgi:hypothetical protein
MATNPDVTLLNISWEIRDQIWKHLKPDDIKISIPKSCSSASLEQDGVPANQWKDGLLKDPISCAPVLLVNRQVNQECRDIHRRSVRLFFYYHQDLEQCIPNMTRKATQAG